MKDNMLHIKGDGINMCVKYIDADLKGLDSPGLLQIENQLKEFCKDEKVEEFEELLIHYRKKIIDLQNI